MEVALWLNFAPMRFVALALAASVASALPLQAHLSLTTRQDELRLVWTSGSAGGVPTVVYYQDSGRTMTVTGTNRTYTIDQLCAAPANDPANWEDPGQINVVTMSGLVPGKRVYFSYGTSVDGMANSSSLYRGAPGATGARFVIIGDMGGASESIDMMQHEIDNTSAVLFVGDLSYAMGRKGYWANWFQMVSPVFSKVPVQFCPGNHDVLQLPLPLRFWPSWGTYELDSGTQGECGVPYSNLVSQDGGVSPVTGARVENNNWTSLDFPGVAHVVMISTEHNFTQGSEQAAWLVSDLARVNRSYTPWVIVGMHRPMYDSTFNALLPEQAATREILEPVFEAGGVDLVLTAHVHDYQSMHCRIYNGTCRGGASDAAGGPIGRPVMLVGGGGKTSGVRTWMDWPAWLSTRTNDLGYARFEPVNATSAYWEWVFNTNGTTFDEHWIERPVVGAARAARERGDPDAPRDDASPDALEQWRRLRVREWFRTRPDPFAAAAGGLSNRDAVAVAHEVQALVQGQVVDPHALFAQWD
jgi:acid phosphatase type 7